MPVKGSSGLPKTQRLLRIARSLEFMVFPILGLILSQFIIVYFESNGWRTGLIKELVPIFWLILGYRVLAGILYATLSDEAANRYTSQLLKPFTILIGLGLIWRTLSGTFPLGDMVLFRILDTRIVLRTLVSAAIVLYFFIVAAWIIRDLLRRGMSRREHADAGVTNAVVVTTYYTILALGVLTAMTMLGFNLSTLTVVLGGLSVGISFGLQELVANFVSGILLVYEHTLRPGDVIRVGGQSGTVDELRLRATVLRTIDNVEIFVPNRTLLTSTVETYTHSDRNVRRMVGVGVTYDCQPETVRELLLGVADRHGLVLKSPAPTVLFSDFADSSLNFQLAFWVNDPPRAQQVTSDLRFMIFREFARNGIEIPYPQRDLHVRSGMSQVDTGPDDQPLIDSVGLPA
jgi:potassium efflux system protein